MSVSQVPDEIAVSSTTPPDAPVTSEASFATTGLERSALNAARVREELDRLLPAGSVITDPDSLERYAHDEAEWAPYALPLAVIRPTTATQVQAVVRLCVEHRVPVVARGAGTGLSGGANALDGSVVVELRADGPDSRNRPGRAAGRGAAGGDQRPAAGGLCRAGALVPAGPGQLALVHPRRQRGHQRRWSVLREVRRDRRLRPGARGGHRDGRARAARSADGERGRRVRPEVAPGRLRGHARPGHRDHHPAAAAAAARAHRGRLLHLLGGGRGGGRGRGPRRCRPVGAGAARPTLPSGGQRLEEPRTGGRCGGDSAGPGRCAGCGR